MTWKRGGQNKFGVRAGVVKGQAEVLVYGQEERCMTVRDHRVGQ